MWPSLGLVIAHARHLTVSAMSAPVLSKVRCSHRTTAKSGGLHTVQQRTVLDSRCRLSGIKLHPWCLYSVPFCKAQTFLRSSTPNASAISSEHVMTKSSP
eukprot:5379046-Amphidinium_carterae.1